MPKLNDASYFAERAKAEIKKATEAKLRGENSALIALHAELAVRYQAKALRLQRS